MLRIAVDAVGPFRHDGGGAAEFDVVVDPVRLLEERDEFARPVTLGNDVVHNTGGEIDGRRKGDGTEPLAFVIALDGGVPARLGRQVRGRGAAPRDEPVLVAMPLAVDGIG
jgi:hypothetical protein